MPQVSSRAGRNRHPYVGMSQREFDAQSNSMNPTMIQWATSTIKRNGDRVRAWREDVLVYDSSTAEKPNFNTKNIEK